MTEDRPPLAELLAKAGDGDFLRSVAQAVVQLLMETDSAGAVEQGSEAPGRRGRDLPQQERHHPPDWRRAASRSVKGAMVRRRSRSQISVLQR